MEQKLKQSSTVESMSLHDIAAELLFETMLDRWHRNPLFETYLADEQE